MANDLGQMLFSIEADLTRLEKQMKSADRITRDNFNLLERRAKRAAKSVDDSFRDSARQVDRHLSSMGKSMSNALGGVSRTAMGALGAALSVTQLARYADSWTSAQNKISAAGEELGNVSNRMSQVADVAMRSRSNFDATVDLYTGLSRSAKELGANQTQVLAVTETISKAFAVGGQSASTAAGAILQLNQAFASGKLSGDELNSVLEGAPPLARLIATEFGVSVGALKKLGEEGKLSADRVFTAILKGQTEIESEFRKTSATIGQSFENLRTAFVRWLGIADQATGASKRIAEGIGSLANNMQIVGPIAASLAAGLLATFVGGPIAGGVAAVGTAFVLLGDQIKPISGQIATLADYGRAAFDMLRTTGGGAADAFGQAWQRAADLLSLVLSGATNSGEQLVAAVKVIVNSVIGAFVVAGNTIQAAWSNLGAGLADAITKGLNATIAAIEAALQRIVGAVNSVLGAINSASGSVGLPSLGTIPVPNLSRIENSYRGAGAAAAQAFSDGASAINQDYVGSALDKVQGALDRLRQKANEAAEYRAEDRRRQSQAEMNAGRKDGSINQKLKPSTPEAKGGGGSGGESENAFERQVAAIERQARAYDVQRESLSKSATEAARARAEFQLLESAKKADVDVTDELKVKIGALADAYANAKTRLDEAREAQALWRDAAQEFTSTLSQGFSQVVIEGGKLNEVLSSLLKRLASKAFERLFEMLLMGSSGGGGGAMGGVFGAIGKALGFADGGPVRGPGTGTSDSIPAMLSHGEYVIRASQASKFGPLLAAINEGRVGRFASGGLATAARLPSVAPAAAMALGGSSTTIAPSISVQVSMPPGGDAKQGDEFGARIGKQVEQMVRATIGDELRRQQRPGGTLAR